MPLHRFTFRAMAAENEVQVHAEDAAHASMAAQAAIAEVKRIEAKYSRYLPGSVVSRINDAAGRDGVQVDDETRVLLDFAHACHEQSGGLFDATSGVLRRAWRFDGDRVPTDEELAPLVALIGWRHVEREGRTVRLAKAGMQLDFGGFGKEYAVDRAAAVLASHGARSALVNLAGDLMALGPQPGDEPWQVGIQHPRKPATLIARLPLTAGAIATSGDYERYMEVDGLRHSHVLDPRTGRSVASFQSVTAHAPTCLVAGSATTIAMLLGERQGRAWLDTSGLKHFCIGASGEVIDAFR
jgi:thiamine biosynthesis lipoprotein